MKIRNKENAWLRAGRNSKLSIVIHVSDEAERWGAARARQALYRSALSLGRDYVPTRARMGRDMLDPRCGSCR